VCPTPVHCRVSSTLSSLHAEPEANPVAEPASGVPHAPVRFAISSQRGAGTSEDGVEFPVTGGTGVEGDDVQEDSDGNEPEDGELVEEGEVSDSDGGVYSDTGARLRDMTPEEREAARKEHRERKLAAIRQAKAARVAELEVW
jgi:hypothetical protein